MIGYFHLIYKVGNFPISSQITLTFMNIKNKKIKRSARVRNEWRYEWLKVLMIDLLLEIDNFRYSLEIYSKEIDQ